MEVKNGQLLVLRVSGTYNVCGYFLVAKVDEANNCVKGLMYWQGPSGDVGTETRVTGNRLEPFLAPMREEFACHTDSDDGKRNVVARHANLYDIDRFTFMMRDSLRLITCQPEAKN